MHFFLEIVLAVAILVEARVVPDDGGILIVDFHFTFFFDDRL